jgi:hypothetical protein
VVEVAFDFLLTHIVGMALVIEQNELTDPVDIGLFSSMTEVFLPTGDSHLIKQTWFARFSGLTL